MSIKRIAIDPKDLKRLITAQHEARQWLERNKPRRAAEVLCRELGWLVGNEDFWSKLDEGCKELSHFKKNHPALFGEAGLFEDAEELIGLEKEAFKKLKIGDDECAAPIASVYDAFELLKEQRFPSSAVLRNLRERLAVAAHLVCKESRGPFKRAISYMASMKGIRIISGTAVIGVNVAVAHFDLGVLSWKSVTVGATVIGGDIEKLIKLFTDKKGK